MTSTYDTEKNVNFLELPTQHMPFSKSLLSVSSGLLKRVLEDERPEVCFQEV